MERQKRQDEWEKQTAEAAQKTREAGNTILKPVTAPAPLVIHSLCDFRLVKEQYCIASFVDGDWVVLQSSALNHNKDEQ
ncbi:MAG: hypothetical protein ACPGLY_25420 [Rubripirellula sp.]